VAFSDLRPTDAKARKAEAIPPGVVDVREADGENVPLRTRFRTTRLVCHSTRPYMSASSKPWAKMNHREIARSATGGVPAKSSTSHQHPPGLCASDLHMILISDTENSRQYYSC
jgi:hypothetical protein